MPREPRFDQHLEDDLHLLLDRHSTGTIPAWRMPEPGRRGLPIVRGAGVALTAKIAVGAVVAVMAAGATTEAVITHSVIPTPVVSAPALPTVTPPAVPSVGPLPIPSPSIPALP